MDGFVGKPVKRREDQRFLTGAGRYIADLHFDGLCHMVVVRAQYPHAAVTGIDTAEARRMPGVLGVWTGEDTAADGLGGIPWERRPPMPPGTPKEAMPEAGDPNAWPPQPILSDGVVRYLGQPVACVVAETAAVALDAAEAVLVEYEPRRALMSVREATAPGAPALWEKFPDNVCFRFHIGDAEKAAAGFAKASHVVRLSTDICRLVQNPMETRGYVGLFDGQEERYTLHAAAGKPQSVGRALARDVFRIPEDRVRVITKDVGGGFGSKNPLYPEQALVLYAARKLGRPVRWLALRQEGFLSDYQGRGQSSDAELALDGDGRILALRVRVMSDVGGYLGPRGATAPLMWDSMGTSVYDFPAVDYDVAGVHTNAMPTCPYRGAGAPEANFVLERLMDLAADELGIAPAEMRRRNLVPKTAMPYRTAASSTYDSGDFLQNMDVAEQIADLAGFAARRAESEARGLRRGIGYGNVLESCGAGIGEKAEISCTPDGQISLRIGTMSNGQSHETVYAQMLADKLGIPMDRIQLIQGDSNETPMGMGTGASRSMTVGGSALVLAADKLVERGREIAADMLETAAADIDFAAGAFRIAGTDRQVTLERVAERAIADGAPSGRGLEGVFDYDPPDATYPNGCHIAEVEVDPDTGTVRLCRYSMTQDVGLALNPMVVEGQLVGGVAQGIGEALMERTVYDEGSGQVLTGSFMDYGMPRADDLPLFTTRILEVPSKNTPTGVKSVGEAGPTASPVAVVNAIVDALRPLGVRHLELPATSESVLRAILAAQSEEHQN